MANEFGNYGTLIGAGSTGNTTFTNGNREIINTSGTAENVFVSIPFPTTGKTYVEFTLVARSSSSTAPSFGLTPKPYTAFGGGDHIYLTPDGAAGDEYDLYIDTSLTTQDYMVIAVGSVVQIAYDADTGKVWFGDDNTFVGDPAGGSTQAGTLAASGEIYYLTFRLRNAADVHVNTGQTAFAHTPPTGYDKRLATQYQTTPAIINTDDHYYSVVLTHDGSSTATTCTFNLDTYEWLAIIKNTTGAVETWYVINSLNGANKYHTWESFVQATDANVMTVSGTTLTLGSTLGAKDYLIEVHRAGLASATAANTEGDTNTIATTVNLVSGFGMSEFTGTGSNTTVGHGMDIAPALTIPNNNTIADGHYFLHTGSGDPDLRLNMGTTQAGADDASNFNGSYPSATVITLGSADRTNKSGSNIVLYYWHGVEGYSSFGTYEGSGGGATAPFINTGSFVGAVITKSIDSTSGWQLFSSTATTTNPRAYLGVQQTAILSDVSEPFDIYSNGFKSLVAFDPNVAETYIYTAWGGRPLTDDGINQGRADGIVKPFAQAYGGTITQAGGFFVHSFTVSGTFIPTKNGNVELLVVGGGGGGDMGGGGAGGYRTASSVAVVAGTAVTVTVGAGGTGGNTNATVDPDIKVGGNSSFGSALVSTGGGGGADNGGTTGSTLAAAITGGSAGGLGQNSSRANIAIGLGNAGGFSPSEGNNGGDSSDAADAYGGGGGGGASAVGADGSDTAAGAGGAGTANTITGASVTYAGGGAGGRITGSDAAGGAGGGGASGVAGTANTGGGGGGGRGASAGGTNFVAGGGGSGIVIVKYAIS